jgi:hypothetical protein
LSQWIITRDHNEGVARETALQRLLICVNSHGLRPISIPLEFKASLTEGNVNENISPSISGGIFLSGDRTALQLVR